MIAVTPIDDAALESNESVVLTVIADSAYSPGSPSEAVVTIVSDDLPPDLIITSVVAASNGGAGRGHRGDRHNDESRDRAPSLSRRVSICR